MNNYIKGIEKKDSIIKVIFKRTAEMLCLFGILALAVGVIVVLGN